LAVTLETFAAAAKRGEEPPYLTPILRALWLDGTGDWRRAHELAGDGVASDEQQQPGFLGRQQRVRRARTTTALGS